MSTRLNISQANRPEWLATRKLYVTASEAGVICLPSSYFNAADVFNEKTSVEERLDFSNDDMTRGVVLEKFLLRKIAKARPYANPQPNTWMYVEEVGGLFSATPDALSFDKNGVPRLAFEIKCPRTLPNGKTSYGKNKRLRYLIQLWIGMRCSGTKGGALCVGEAPYRNENVSIEIFSLEELEGMFSKYIPLLTEFKESVSQGILHAKFW